MIGIWHAQPPGSIGVRASTRSRTQRMLVDADDREHVHAADHFFLDEPASVVRSHQHRHTANDTPATGRRGADRRKGHSDTGRFSRTDLSAIIGQTIVLIIHDNRREVGDRAVFPFRATNGGRGGAKIDVRFRVERRRLAIEDNIKDR